jgi:type IV fimbrial biogenesis protein FimT
MKRNHWVTVCKSTDGSTCNAGADWEDGWLIFSDTNSNGALNVDEQLLRVYPQLKAGFIIDEGGNFANWVAFKPTGAAQGSGGTTDTYALCYDAELDTSRAISISFSGSVQLSEPAASCS